MLKNVNLHTFHEAQLLNIAFAVCLSVLCPIHLKLYMRIYAWGKGPSNFNFKFKITKLWVGYFSTFLLLGWRYPP